MINSTETLKTPALTSALPHITNPITRQVLYFLPPYRFSYLVTIIHSLTYEFEILFSSPPPPMFIYLYIATRVTLRKYICDDLSHLLIEGSHYMRGTVHVVDDTCVLWFGLILHVLSLSIPSNRVAV